MSTTALLRDAHLESHFAVNTVTICQGKRVQWQSQMAAAAMAKHTLSTQQSLEACPKDEQSSPSSLLSSHLPQGLNITTSEHDHRRSQRHRYALGHTHTTQRYTVTYRLPDGRDTPTRPHAGQSQLYLHSGSRPRVSARARVGAFVYGASGGISRRYRVASVAFCSSATTAVQYYGLTPRPR